MGRRLSIGAVGLIELGDDGWTDFHFRNRITVSHTKMHRREFEPGGLIDRVRTVWSLGPLVRVPVGADGAELYLALSQNVASGFSWTASVDDDLIEAARRFADRVDALSAAGEPIAVLDDRLTRVDRLADMLPTLGSALDLRDVFSELSTIARRALPHDFSVVSLNDHEQGWIRRHALSAPEGMTIPEVVDNPYPTRLAQTWVSGINHDLSVHPLEHSMAAAAFGLRSSIRVRIRLDGKTSGALDFSAFQAHRYGDADVPIVGGSPTTSRWRCRTSGSPTRRTTRPTCGNAP